MNELSTNKLFAGEVSLNTPVLKDDLSMGAYAYRALPNLERVAMLRFEGWEQAGTRSVEGTERCLKVRRALRRGKVINEVPHNARPLSPWRTSDAISGPERQEKKT